MTKLGLTDTEYLVYITLLKEGLSLAGPIIKKTQLHRGTVYDVLERLITKGVVSHVVKENKRYYEAASLGKFLDNIEEKKKSLEVEEKETKEALKELSKIKEKMPSSEVQVLSGKEGLKTLMQDIIKERKNFYVLGGNIRFQEVLPVYTIHWAKAREKYKIYAKILTTYSQDSTWKYNETRKLKKEFESPTSTLIYGNKVALFLPEELMIVLIKSENVAKSYMAHFNALWR